MGCITSKPVTKGSPLSISGSNPRRNDGSVSSIVPSAHNRGVSGELVRVKEESLEHSRELKKLDTKTRGNLEKKAVFNVRFGRFVEAEQVAAGWPPWLTSVAGEAVEGWVPLRADLFEKLDKVGQGTYSSVYRARNVRNGKIVALKKVRFDNFQPDSVRFMSREISILRLLDHPNIVKLEGLITNRLSCSIYLVFEYMEHDLAGLLSCPDIKFTEAQIKCYMRQLLDGIEHCHLRGVMHRDIKTSNILVNNEGVLKIADLGLANYITEGQRKALTSRVVTLWYRPPELLLGSTTYGPYVDLWSVGCVFAELFARKPILKGRTEVEQLHKIFKLCGSPPDEFWKKSKLPLATIFKPQQPYRPDKRGTASTALDSEYFNTRPYACDPSSMPKYPPNKEFDAKMRNETRRRKVGVKARASGGSNNQRKSTKTTAEDQETTFTYARKNSGGNAYILKPKGTNSSTNSSDDTFDEVAIKSQAKSFRSGPLITPSSNSAWAKEPRGNNEVPTRYYNQVIQKSENTKGIEQKNNEAYEKVKLVTKGHKRQNAHTDAFDASHVYDSPEFSVDCNRKQGRLQLVSGPLLPLPNRLDDDQDNYYLPKPVRLSRFYRD